MLYRECKVAGITLSGDTDRTRLINGTDKVIECEICRHAKDGTALNLTDKDGMVTRKWEWKLSPGEIKDDKSDYDVVFESYYYTARVTAEGNFVAGFRIHGGPWSWTGPWLDVQEETEETLIELREHWADNQTLNQLAPVHDGGADGEEAPGVGAVPSVSAAREPQTESPPRHQTQTKQSLGCVDRDGNRRTEEILLFNDECFSKIRKLSNIKDDFLMDFDFGELEAGGGKGGDLMAFTTDGSFLVKEAKETDHLRLLECAYDYAAHMEAAFAEGGKGSLLCQFYKHFQLENGQNFVVMNNFLPTKGLAYSKSCVRAMAGSVASVCPAELAAVRLAVSDDTTSAQIHIFSGLKARGQRIGPQGGAFMGWDLKFDLKGCADDKTQEKNGKRIVEVSECPVASDGPTVGLQVHKRCFKCWMFCCPCCDSDERVQYFEGKEAARTAKFQCTPAQRKAITAMIKGDAQFIAKHNMMDHSLMVGVASHPKAHVELFLGQVATLRVACALMRRLEMEQGKSLLGDGVDVRSTVFPRSVLRDQPYICEFDGRVVALYIGIIDFLQDWNCQKGCARCIKACAPHPKSTEPPEVYKKQFSDLTKRFTDDGDECQSLLMNMGADDEQTAQTRFEHTDMRFESEWEHGFDNEESNPTPVDQAACDQIVDHNTDFSENAWFSDKGMQSALVVQPDPAGTGSTNSCAETTSDGGWFGLQRHLKVNENTF